jgi:hypothetical protein
MFWHSATTSQADEVVLNIFFLKIEHELEQTWTNQFSHNFVFWVFFLENWTILKI